MAKMSQKDLELIRYLREEGVLQEVREQRLNFENGVISLPCSDGDQSHDWRTHLGGLVARQRGEVRDHVVALNGGGALLLSPASPLRTLAPVLPKMLLEGSDWPKCVLYIAALFLGLIGFMLRQDLVVLANIWGAIKLKNIKTVVMQLHFPCGAAGLCHMTAWEQLDHLVRAKQRLKRVFKQIRVPCFVHVDWPEDEGSKHRRRTYFVKTSELRSWLSVYRRHNPV